jgi:hypothetical protein
LEIENLIIGLGGFFNNKVDLGVLFLKRAKKGNFYLFIYLFIDFG